MADVFISYKNTPERRALVRRLALILRVHDISVWWDHGLEAGQEFQTQIEGEIAAARLVIPLWCTLSVCSDWVRREAALGRERLLPAVLQAAQPPAEFASIHAADLVGWSGSVREPMLVSFIEIIRRRLGASNQIAVDMLTELDALPLLTPLATVDPRVEQVLNWIRAAAMSNYDYSWAEAGRITFSTAITELLGDGSPEELVDEFYRLKDCTGTLEEVSIDAEDLEGLESIGEMANLIAERLAER